MNTFYQPVDLRSRKAMENYLSKHFRYNTMSSWNNSTSYACDLKIHHQYLDNGTVEKLLDAIEASSFYDTINLLCNNFDASHDYLWQTRFNGSSGGYLVLYQGGQKDTGRPFVYLRRPTDMNRDFSDWDMDQLRERVRLVQEFDQLADAIVEESVRIVSNYEVKDEIHTVKEIRKVLVPIKSAN